MSSTPKREADISIEEQGKLNQLTFLGDPIPINLDASEYTKEVEGKAEANTWVNNNIIRLSQEFGVAFDGCIEEACNRPKKGEMRYPNFIPSSRLDKTLDT